MIALEPRTATSVKSIARPASAALALLTVMLWTPSVHAYKWYDNGSGTGCVSCHTGFVGGNGPLHLQHRTRFGVVTCNLCHQNGGGTKPVLTYWSGPGGGYGCAGCHGQDYGETSPTSGLPKATSYGLRRVHVANGVTACGPSGCHQPGALGAPDPFPTLYGENVPPPYYNPMFSQLTDPCSSQQEDLPFDADSVGLDNDGNGAADYPADSNCPPPPTPTATPTPGISCGMAPAQGCIASGKGSLLVDEKKPGKERLDVTLGKLQAAVTPGEFGDPVAGTTAYALCIYDALNQLAGQYPLVRAGATCNGKPCWKLAANKHYVYTDKFATAAGIAQAKLSSGATGKGKIKIKGKNTSNQLPTGVTTALLQNQSQVTVQVVSSNAACFSLDVTKVKKADGSIFKAAGP